MVTVPSQSLSPSAGMGSRDQRRSSSNSPYQHTPNSSSLLPSPAYPSPARSDTETSKYSAGGLGLYQYSQPFSTSAGPPGPILFPPSPRPTGAWNGASPIASAPIVNPWTSGAYDHPVYPDSRSLLWPHDQSSHRSSFSSQRETSVFSGDGSEHAFPHIKLEGGSGWTTDEEFAPSATVAPARLTRSNNTPYDGAYSSPMSPYESDGTPGPAYTDQLFSQNSSKGRPTSSHSDSKAIVTRKGHRRARKSKEPARYSCEICGTGFVRLYNKNTHLARHNPNRPKDNMCTFDGCDMRFERKTDLERHINSVHLKLKLFECDLCGKRFPRKDTLARHRHDGSCPRSNQVEIASLLARRRSMQSSPSEPQAYYPSPQPEVYSGFQSAQDPHGLFGARGQHGADGGIFDARFSLFRDEGYGANAHGL